MAIGSNGRNVILMKKSSKADLIAWADAHYDNLHWDLTCRLGTHKRDVALRMLERRLRNSRIRGGKAE